MLRDAANLVVASRLFKDKIRASAFTFLYSFMREVDDLVDDVAERLLSPSEKERILKSVEELEAMTISLHTRTDNKSARRVRFNKIQQVFGIPEELWRNFFKSMWMDFNLVYPQSYKDFLAYAEGASVAATTIYLILICAQKQPDNSYDWTTADILTTGRNLGIWAYTIHISRDLKSDCLAGESGRRLIPCDLFTRHGLTETDIRSQARPGDQRVWNSKGKNSLHRRQYQQ